MTFKLDRTAPELNLPDLIDGIAWDVNTHLKGSVQDNLGEVEVTYRIGSGNAQAITSATSSATGMQFDQLLSELANLNKEEVYNLTVETKDRAGNAQRQSFQFFVPGDRNVVDDDQWTEPIGDPLLVGNPLDPSSTSDPTNLGSVGLDGNWGAYGLNGGGGGTGTWVNRYSGNGGGGIDGNAPDTTKATLSGSAYDFDYAPSVGMIVTEAVNRISTHPATVNEKAALNNRKSILMAIAQRLETLITPHGFDETSDQTLIDRMRFVMEGLFADAYDSKGDHAGIEPGFESLAGAVLAQELVRDSLSATNPTSVRVQVFAATLLNVVTEATLNSDMMANSTNQQSLANAVMELAKTYAWLHPTPEASVPADKKDFGFLDALWRLQIPNADGQFKSESDIATALSEGVQALGRLLNGVENPVRAIQFINNLLQAANNVSSVKADLKDAQSIRKLIDLLRNKNF